LKCVKVSYSLRDNTERNLVVFEDYPPDTEQENITSGDVCLKLG
jgi:hypothetical protein